MTFSIFFPRTLLLKKKIYHIQYIILCILDGDKVKKDENNGEGVVIGPLEGPIPHDNGNGPQEKETKDLHQGNVSPTGILTLRL